MSQSAHDVVHFLTHIQIVLPDKYDDADQQCTSCVSCVSDEVGLAVRTHCTFLALRCSRTELCRKLLAV